MSPSQIESANQGQRAAVPPHRFSPPIPLRPAVSRQLPRTARRHRRQVSRRPVRHAIFADPPYFLSNGGITCHAGKMVKVDKGDWDKSRGPELNHEFNLEWLRRCQRVLKPNGTIWVTGTHHVIFSIGYAMQQLGYQKSQRHRLGKTQPAAQPELPLLHPFHRNHPVGRQKRKEQTRLQLSGHAQSDRQADENRLARFESDNVRRKDMRLSVEQSANMSPAPSETAVDIWTIGPPTTGKNNSANIPRKNPSPWSNAACWLPPTKTTWCWTRFSATAPRRWPPSASNASASASNWICTTSKWPKSASKPEII